MEMKKAYYILTAFMAFCLGACSNEDVNDTQGNEEHGEALTLQATVGQAVTRATANKDYIGRDKFVGAPEDNTNAASDEIELTLMQRTVKPIAAYTYNNIHYKYIGTSWVRTTDDPEYIYWSDNKSGHTMIGYSTPMAWKDGDTYRDNKWTADYCGQFDSTDGIVDFTDNDKISSEDLLISYSTEMQSDIGGGVATMHFRHALASIRVIVNIRGYSADDGTTQDARTKVSDMTFPKQPWKYKWNQEPTTSENIEIPGWGVMNNTTEADGTKTITSWIPNVNGEYTGSSRIFTFYSLMVPGTRNDMEFEFTIKYPNGLNHSDILEKKYKASLETIKFLPGYTTTVNISLNHENEEMTIGAEYIDWEFVETPDQSVLKKKSTFLGTTSRDSVTIATQVINGKPVTIDDATWLYQDPTDNNKVKDIYGNTGGETDPYSIESGYQFLSFAYEVKNGRTFEGQYVKLDAGLFLQKSMTDNTLNWIGVGDASNPFNGTFVGGVRLIKRLKGQPLFLNIGEKGYIEQLLLEDVLGITGNGAMAEINNGVIAASKVASELMRTMPLSGSAPFVGTNNGLIFACYAIGAMSTSATTVGGLVATNNGVIAASYAGISIPAAATVGGIAGNNGGTIDNCYFSTDLITSTYSDDKATGKTTIAMQKEDFANELNNYITGIGTPSWWKDTYPDKLDRLKTHHYTYQVANFPWVY